MRPYACHRSDVTNTFEPRVNERTRVMQVPQECPEGVADLIARCIAKDPDTRPTAKEVVDVLMRQVILNEGLMRHRGMTR